MSSDQPPALALELLGNLTVRESQARRLEVLARRVPIVEALAAAGYPVRDGRTGLHLTREAADDVLRVRMAAEVRPWAVDELVASSSTPLEDLERARAVLDAAGGWQAEPGPSVPINEPAQRRVTVHPAKGDDGPPGPLAPTPECSRPGSLGRHPVPAGPGVRSCPCGAVTRHPAP